MATLRSPWSKWALMRRSSILKLSAPLVPLKRLRSTCRKKRRRCLTVKSKVNVRRVRWLSGCVFKAGAPACEPRARV